MSNSLFESLPESERIKHLGSNRFVRLVDVFGDDSRIVQAARVSYGAGTKTLREDRGLIFHLMRNRHTSPLEMPKMLFHIRAELFSKNQMVRTRTANWNEESARYSEMRDDFWVPDPSEIRLQQGDNKQGSEGINSNGALASGIIDSQNKTAYAAYQSLLGMGVPREQARAVLPQTLLVEWYYCIDLNNLTKTLALRMDSHAQKEVRDIFALGIFPLFQHCFPVVAEAFEYCYLNGATFTAGQLGVLRAIVEANMGREQFESFALSSIPSKDERNTLIQKVWGNE